MEKYSVDITCKDCMKTKAKFRMDKVKEKWDNAKNWVMENADIVGYVAGVVLSAGTYVGANVYESHKKKKKLQNAFNEANSHIYDRRVGCYYETIRPLDNKTALEIERRKAATGESLGEILDSMGLLK